MALNLFRRKAQAQVPALTARESAEAEELSSYAEATAEYGLNEGIRLSLEKAMASTEYYQYMAGMGEDGGGNYFGQEFNIRATAQRIKSLYGREPWMFATAWLIARTLSTVPFKVVNVATEEEDENHPLNKRLKAGSTVEDHKSKQVTGYLDLILGGNFIDAFDETFTQAIRVPVENVEPDIAEDCMSIRGYWTLATESGKRTYIPATQVVHHKFPNPYHPFWGMSLFTAASRPILLDRLKNEFEFAFYLRGGTSMGVVETTDDINKTRMKRLLRTFEQTYTGKRNWWRQIFLPKGAKWVSTGFNFDQLKHFDGLRENRLSLLAVLGIPPSKVGIVQDVNRSTSETQDKDLWTNTIKPLAEFIASGWNNSYLVKTIYGGTVKVVADFSDVEALQGSLEVKGAQAKAVEPYFWIDEIRKNIFNEEPLPNGAGEKFVAEVRGSGQGSPLGLLSAPSEPVTVVPAAQLDAPLTAFKAQATSSQDRIERILSKQFASAYGAAMKDFFTLMEGLIKSAESGETLKARIIEGIRLGIKDLMQNYWSETNATYGRALERGFSFANSNAKSLSGIHSKKHAPNIVTVKSVKNKVITGAILKSKFNDNDQQAIDALRERDNDNQRSILRSRSLQRFVGMTETRTNEVLNIAADMLESGTTLEAIAEQIRNVHSDRYGDQSFTIARTEVLTAVSQGMKWNQDVLQEVFSKTQKQWFHVGDAGSNPNAREEHADFEQEGVKDYGYKWGGILEYPRDPSGGPSEVINCRCTMVTVIPDDAESNADVILERV